MVRVGSHLTLACEIGAREPPPFPKGDMRPHPHRVRGGRHTRARGDAPAYRTASTRHVDFPAAAWAGGPLSFYVCDYGPCCGAPSGSDADAGALYRLHFDDEHNTERMDVLLAPERLATEHARSALADYVRTTLRGPADSMWAARHPVSLTVAAKRLRAEQRPEWVYRAVLLGALRASAAAPALAYATYAALSPLHERSFDEIAGLVAARTGAPVGADAVAAALAWLAERRLVRLLPLRTLHVHSAVVARCDYDYGLTARVRALLVRPFALAPGTAVDEAGAYVMSQRSKLRRTVNAFRFERICEQLERQRAAEQGLAPPVQLRLLTEYSVLLDVLHVHGLGASGEVAPTTDGWTAPQRPPRRVTDLVLACSCLDAPPVAPIGSPGRSRSSSSSQSTSSASSDACTPRATNPWGVYAGIDWSASSDEEGGWELLAAVCENDAPVR